MASAGRVFLYLIGAAAVLGITWGFYYAIGKLSVYLGEFSLTTPSTVWTMAVILAVLIVFSGIAKDHANLEILSSISFLVYVLFAYAIGGTILTLFIPYNGLGTMNLQFAANLTNLHLNIPISEVSALIVYSNLFTAVILIVGQAFRFLNTLAKADRTKVSKTAPAKER